MAVAIRLRREGSKNRPFYRLVVADKKTRRDGRFIEILGTYNPTSPLEKNYDINVDRAEYWVGVGAQPSQTAKSLIRKARKWADEHPEEEQLAPQTQGQPAETSEETVKQVQKEAAEAKAATSPEGESLEKADPKPAVEADKAADNAGEKPAPEVQEEAKAQATADETQDDQKDQPQGAAKEQETVDTKE
jgi:small subunit ribosomal protein S16